jgi:hypothetical protein
LTCKLVNDEAGTLSGLQKFEEQLITRSGIRLP